MTVSAQDNSNVETAVEMKSLKVDPKTLPNKTPKVKIFNPKKAEKLAKQAFKSFRKQIKKTIQAETGSNSMVDMVLRWDVAPLAVNTIIYNCRDLVIQSIKNRANVSDKVKEKALTLFMKKYTDSTTITVKHKKTKDILKTMKKHKINTDKILTSKEKKGNIKQKKPKKTKTVKVDNNQPSA